MACLFLELIMNNLELYLDNRISLDGYIAREQQQIKAELPNWSDFAEYQKSIDSITIMEKALDQIKGGCDESRNRILSVSLHC